MYICWQVSSFRCQSLCGHSKPLPPKRANQILGLTGQPFWQEESYDRLVRDSASFERIRRYIEENPVNAGLVKTAADYRWSGPATNFNAAEFKQ